ncbi:MAG: hypothetical protein P4L53_06340 [Candidatus Obscuribacterales bacterium]|nr:hypothetical protein [Candidatus Obscuribacterales bacterium]
MPNKMDFTCPVAFILGLLLLAPAVYMWPTDRLFYSFTGATALVVMISAVVFGIRLAKLDRFGQDLYLQGYIPERIKSPKRR